MNRLNTIDWIALILLIIGGINWGLVGVFDFNLVSALFGDASFLTRLIYDLVGLSGVYMIVSLIAKSGE